ncbi:MAG: hypothetical protein AAF657_08540 [Acidobacteriota bacterium]
MFSEKLGYLFLFLVSMVVWMLPPAILAEPFSEDDFDAVYTDAGTVHYLLSRTCLATACSGAASPACTTGDSITSKNCNIGIHDFCVDRGHVSGFGVQNADDINDVDITCLTAKVAEVVEDVPLTALQAKVPGCNSTEPSKACSVAIDRYCRHRTPPPREWLMGFGPLESNANETDITCIRSEAVANFAPHPADVEQLVPGCSFASPTVSTNCRQAMHEYCQGEGSDLRGGIGPMEYSSSGMAVGCVEKRWPWTSNLPAMPEAPALPIDIIGRKIDVNTKKYVDHLEHAALSADRSLSFDGRVQAFFRMIGGVPHLNFRVQTPEIFSASLTQAQTGGDRSYETGFLGNHYGVDVIHTEFHNATGGRFKAGSAICDPHRGSSPMTSQTNRQQNIPSRVSNPFTCDAQGNFDNGGTYDCYDLKLITVYDTASPSQNDLHYPDQLWEASVQVVVENPKASDVNGADPPSLTRARVISATVDPASLRSFETDMMNVLEPNISGDGRLLVVQGDGKLRYSVMPEFADPCNVTEWSTFKSISEMHGDFLMADYGIAKYPMRDHEGNLLSGQEIRGAYPWLGRDGDNMMFMLGAATLYYMDGAQVQEKFEVLSHPAYGSINQIPTCPPDLMPCPTVPLHPTNLSEVQSVTDRLPREGLTFVGLWSQGKMISPDNRNNAVDFGIKGGEHQHREIRLYTGLPLDQPGTEVGTSIRTDINSAQNQFFYNPNLLPDTPREVVWTLSTQDQTDEMAFDDVLDPRALIISPMNVSIKPSATDKGRFQDGFVYTGDYTGEGFQRPAHIANAATSVGEAVVAQALQDSGVNLTANVQWNIPAFGYVLGGARAEPIAAGGYKGKGLWLDGSGDRLEYLVPPPPASRVSDMEDSPWFYSISIDPRDLSTQRRLLSLPDNNWLDVVDAQTLRLGRNGHFDVSLGELALEPGVWSTISVLSVPALGGGSDISVYADGYLLKTQYVIQDFYRMTSGMVTVGDATNGFLGWVDDFKIIARAPSPEVICNHARGTLVGVQLDSQSDHRNEKKALLYPMSSHQAISSLLLPAERFPGYACERPIADPTTALDFYSHDHYACLGQTRRTTAAECVRSQLLFPEGPLFVDQPRPASIANTFCTSCHIDSNPSVTMQATPALGSEVSLMPDDSRRQPMQHPPKFFGNILQHFFGDAPDSDIQAQELGDPLDPYTETCLVDQTKCNTP